jgi:anti-sigma B factor antagonist
MDSKVPADMILVAVESEKAFVRVNGRGSFQVSPALKKFVSTQIEKGCRRLILDLKFCTGMDSTFMGVLAGLAVRIKSANQGEVVAVNLSSKSLGLLETLGLTRLIRVYLLHEPADAVGETGSAGETRLEMTPDTRLATETMLAAHETLVEIDPANLPKFQDVLAYLREDLKAQGDPDKKT